MDDSDKLLDSVDKMMMQLMSQLPDEVLEQQVLRMVLIYKGRHDMTMHQVWEHFAKVLYENS